MSDETIEHLSVALFASLPAIIAAISSLRNGREQKRVRKELEKVNGVSSSGLDGKSLKKKAAFSLDDAAQASNPDWYSAPKLW